MKQFCKHDHDTFLCGRRKDGYCKECMNEYRIKHAEKLKSQNKEWYENNKELVIEKGNQYYYDNQEKILVKRNEKRKQNYEKVLAYYRIYTSNHREEYRLYNLKRKPKRKLRIPKFGQDDILEFYRSCPKGMVVDHIIPLCGKLVSGLHVRWNLQYLTPEENKEKGNKVDLLALSNLYG